jgi:SWIM/SEC-C metal-binding protein
MSKFFFKGRIDAREKYQRFGYNTNKQTKLGSADLPLQLLVESQQRQQEIQKLVNQHSLVANIEVDSQKQEDIRDLEFCLNKPQTQTNSKTQNRNDLCQCGSGKKFKKCCSI